MAARLLTLISLAAGALGDSCVGLSCLTRGEHFWRGTDADGQPLLLNLVFGSDKLSASGTLTSGTNTSEPFEATVSEETAELLITWSVGVQEWSGIVVAMDPGSLLLHGSEGTIDSLALSSPHEAGGAGENVGMAVKQPASMQSLVQLSAPGSTIRLRDDAAGLCLRERMVDGVGAVGFAPCEEAGTSWHVLAGRSAEMRSLRGESGLCLQRKLYTSRHGSSG